MSLGEPLPGTPKSPDSPQHHTDWKRSRKGTKESKSLTLAFYYSECHKFEPQDCRNIQVAMKELKNVGIDASRHTFSLTWLDGESDEFLSMA